MSQKRGLLKGLENLQKIYLNDFKRDELDFQEDTSAYEKGNLKIEPVLKKANKIQYHFLRAQISDIHADNSKTPLRKRRLENLARNARTEYDNLFNYKKRE